MTLDQAAELVTYVRSIDCALWALAGIAVGYAMALGAWGRS